MPDEPLTPRDVTPELIASHTPARLFVGRAGPSLPTSVRLQLLADHAAARDAVTTELNLSEEFLQRFEILSVSSQARTKLEYLRQPHKGRLLALEARDLIVREVSHPVDVQVVIGDGLSARAVEVQVPDLLPRLLETLQQPGWRVGRPILVRHCRVGIMNDLGSLLHPTTVVLLIGERPGLATAESLSAYLAYRPRPGHTDAERNLISNIHSAGVPHDDAVVRIVAYLREMMAAQTSGVAIKEPSRSDSALSASQGHAARLTSADEPPRS